MATAFRRVVLVVLDSAGVGEAPDAAAFGDEGSNTLGHIHEQVGLVLPNLAQLGLCRLLPIPEQPVKGCWGRMTERSLGKDTTTGHWELAGAHVDTAFPVYPDGFPADVMAAFEQATGRGWLCNRPYSGTQVIEDFGSEHLETGKPIVYTSGDSVFQIAAHIECVPVAELHRWCVLAREILRGEHAVGRVIARPFTGEPGRFERVQGDRRDFSLLPPPGCLPQVLHEAGHPVYAVGKIEDIFAGIGITDAVHTDNNDEGMEQTIRAVVDRHDAFVFTNLVDFDSMYGHRNNPQGYAAALERADAGIGELVSVLRETDLLILTADHGNDPTTPSTDHSREQVPLLCYAHGLRPRDLGVRESFADLGQSVAAVFGCSVPHGRSFLDQLVVAS